MGCAAPDHHILCKPCTVICCCFFNITPKAYNLISFSFVMQGVVISALVYYLQTWCISKKGPVFAAMFSPLLLIIVGIFSAIAFAERLHLGR